MIPLRRTDHRFLWYAAFVGLLVFGLARNAEPQSPPSSTISNSQDFEVYEDGVRQDFCAATVGDIGPASRRHIMSGLRTPLGVSGLALLSGVSALFIHANFLQHRSRL